MPHHADPFRLAVGVKWGLWGHIPAETGRGSAVHPQFPFPKTTHTLFPNLNHRHLDHPKIPKPTSTTGYNRLLPITLERPLANHVMSSPPTPWSLTTHLLASEKHLYKSATQPAFIHASAEGRVSKADLSRWLATDRLYIHSYIRAAGQLLSDINLPPHLPHDSDSDSETQLADWLIESLVSIRKEERFFTSVAARYGLSLDVPYPDHYLRDAHSWRHIIDAEDDDADYLDRLGAIQAVFESVPRAPSTKERLAGDCYAEAPLLPWLEGALVFWGTERCYLDAWSFARERAEGYEKGGGEDADGGALRKEFIPNWSSDEFRAFVDRLGGLIDRAVVEVLERPREEDKEKLKEGILKRVEARWKTLLEAEQEFWPSV